MSKPIRIMMTGVGGQGTLTATTLLARAALRHGLDVTSGEIHGMAQRGGVVESTLLINCKSPKIGTCEADILLGFEPLETLRALHYLKPGGLILSSSEFLSPLSVATGQAECPSLDIIREAISAASDKVVLLPCQSIGERAGAVQSGNVALLGALCALGALPFGTDVLAATVAATMKPAIADINLTALEHGAAAAREAA